MSDKKVRFYDAQAGANVDIKAVEIEPGVYALAQVDPRISLIDTNATGATAAVAAQGNLIVEALPVAGTPLVIGNKTYTFVVGAPVGDQIRIGVDTATCADNIAAKVNADTAQTLCTATTIHTHGDRVELLANTSGGAGNSIPILFDGASINIEHAEGDPIVITGSQFTGGAEALANPVEPALPVSLRLSAEGGSVEGGTDDYPLRVQVTNGINIVTVEGENFPGASFTAKPIVIAGIDGDGIVRPIRLVDDGAGGFAIPVKVIP